MFADIVKVKVAVDNVVAKSRTILRLEMDRTSALEPSEVDAAPKYSHA